MEEKPDEKKRTKNKKYEMDTVRDFINEKTTFVVKSGERIEVTCAPDEYGEVQCKDQTGK